VQYPSYVFAETLRDGTAVTVRAAGANDGPKIRRAFLNLERDTVYTRFFGYKADVSDAELGRITGADFERAVALLYRQPADASYHRHRPGEGPGSARGRRAFPQSSHAERLPALRPSHGGAA